MVEPDQARVRKERHRLVGLARKPDLVLASPDDPDAMRERISAVNMLFFGASNALAGCSSNVIAAPFDTVLSGVGASRWPG
jgi:hypothetical protein